MFKNISLISYYIFKKIKLINPNITNMITNIKKELLIIVL